MTKSERKKLIGASYAATHKRKKHPLFGAAAAGEMSPAERRDLIKKVLILVKSSK